MELIIMLFKIKKPQKSLDVFEIKGAIENSGFQFFRGVKSGSPLEVSVQGNKARFVRLSLQTVTSFHLDEVEVLSKSGINVALNKPVLCSSFFNGEIKYQGAGVVNGQKNGGCGFHTQREESPWLLIDLREIIDIASIRVFNREGEFFTRALSLKVEVSSDLKSWDVVFDNWNGLRAFLSQELNDEEKAIAYAAALEHSKAVSLFNRMVAEGRVTEAASFHASINTVIRSHGLAMGPHGFLKTFSFCGDEEKAKICAELKRILDWLNDEFGVSAFITSGTLLGMVREGDFIPHDDDLDICYIGNSSSAKEILEERIALAKFLRGKGCGVQESNVAHYWCVSPGGVKLDIFTGFIEGGRCSINPLPRRAIDERAIFPVKTESFHGHDLTLPSKPESLLQVNYGPNWRKPDPFWKFDWGRAKEEYKFLYFGV
ncbi:discoidin domain-containing protein [Microbulbifer agarilyticus]|uniref:discoidin domain-containing protein n=1 Tax=Microbulbifer agarilyticus TaxID=260552 RepID=UPI001CD6F55A|nr:discoidin domain-containing protein [Microbulbifer agarilyticus]MCA0901406.1 LicD family protein [Microbulbifer agarilyticus]